MSKKFHYQGYGVQPHVANPLDHIVCYCGEAISTHPDGYAVVKCHLDQVEAAECPPNLIDVTKYTRAAASADPSNDEVGMGI
jgi:hypothetical protein